MTAITIDPAQLKENLAAVQAAVAAAAVRAGRDPASVTLVAVSKTHPVETMLAAIAAGLRHFAENRVEEAGEKLPLVLTQCDSALTAELHWHMIGHIQSRKAKDIPSLFSTVHSVDSGRLAVKLAAANAERRPLRILVEINISGEASKSGLAAFNWEHDATIRAALLDELRTIAALPGLTLCGLMTMAPIVEQMEETRPVFAGLRRLRDWLSAETGIALSDLSMGMTDDFPVAIEEGATLIRVGRALFGERNTL